jgi:hypothetical protein
MTCNHAAYGEVEIIPTPGCIVNRNRCETKYFPQDISTYNASYQDESSDDQFYVQPRLVYHIDDGAVEALTKYYKTVFTEGASVLDIASSWYVKSPDAGITIISVISLSSLIVAFSYMLHLFNVPYLH